MNLEQPFNKNVENTVISDTPVFEDFIDSQEYKENEFEKIIMEKHRLAIQLQEVDDFITHHPDRALWGASPENERFVNNELGEFKSVLREKLAGVGNEEQVTNVVWQFGNLVKDLSLREKSLREKFGEDLDEKELGARIFADFTGIEAKGEVLFRRDSFFNLMVCMNEDDHNLFQNVSQHRKGRLYRSCSTAGIYFPKHEISNHLVEYNGSMGRTMAERFYFHERQHALNKLFYLGGSYYANIEPSVPHEQLGKKRVRWALAGIKEELLARIKEASLRPEDTIEPLKDRFSYGGKWITSLYNEKREGGQYIYEPKTSDIPPKEKIDEMLDELGRELERFKDIFNRFDTNGILVYMLVNVPIEDMAQYLEVMYPYFEKRVKYLDAVEDQVMDYNSLVSINKDHIFPDRYHEDLEVLFTQDQVVADIYQKTKKQILATQDDPAEISQETVTQLSEYIQYKTEVQYKVRNAPVCTFIKSKDKNIENVIPPLLAFLEDSYDINDIIDEFKDIESGARALSPHFIDILSQALKQYELTLENVSSFDSSLFDNALSVSIVGKDKRNEVVRLHINFPVDI